MVTGFIFPGQGSQYVGMGKDLYENFELVAKLYDQAEDVLEMPIKRISFEAREDELKQTRFTQPAIFVHSLAVHKLLADVELNVKAVAGHSLGEYSALVAAGAITLEEGLRLVKLRGELMQFSGEKYPGTMAAIIGLSEEIVGDICMQAAETGHVNPANFNSPGQIVISGSIAGIGKAMELAKEQGARRVTKLPVGGAFHSPLMREALTGLTEALSKVTIQAPRVPVYTNAKAQPTQDPENIRELLKEQLLSPVLWQNIIENMVQNGVERFIEIGPSKVLSGLVKRINREIPCIPLGTADDLSNFQKEA